MIQIGSMVGREPAPYISAYSASKAFNAALAKSHQIGLDLSYKDSSQHHILLVEPYYVSTKMVNFKQDFFTITPEAFVESVIKHYNFGSQNAVGHFKHELLYKLHFLYKNQNNAYL